MQLNSVDLSTKLEMESYIPHKNNHSVQYIRHERDGYVSLLSDDGNMNYTMINSMGQHILELCDGKNSVSEIVQNISNQYPTIPAKQIENDTARVFKELTRLNMIQWNTTPTPFSFASKCMLPDDFVLKLCEESDIRELLRFFRSFFSKFESNDTAREMCTYFWGKDRREYSSELLLRQCLYSYYKDYFVIQKSNEIIGAIAVKPSYETFLHSATIQMIAVPESLFGYVLEEIAEYYANFNIKKLNNLYLELAPSMCGDMTKLIQLLNQAKFTQKAVYSKEYGNNEELQVYSLDVTQKRNV